MILWKILGIGVLVVVGIAVLTLAIFGGFVLLAMVDSARSTAEEIFKDK